PVSGLVVESDHNTRSTTAYAGRCRSLRLAGRRSYLIVASNACGVACAAAENQIAQEKGSLLPTHQKLLGHRVTSSNCDPSQNGRYIYHCPSPRLYESCRTALRRNGWQLSGPQNGTQGARRPSDNYVGKFFRAKSK